MKAFVKKDECIGCELCTATCPEVFQMKDGVAVAVNGPVPAGAEDSCREAAADCPVNAIEITE
ncbi:MAG: ferredoxin [Fibrobacter sp.]|nr:ferredoxin [Fibrobacter sp.]